MVKKKKTEEEEEGVLEEADCVLRTFIVHHGGGRQQMRSHRLQMRTGTPSARSFSKRSNWTELETVCNDYKELHQAVQGKTFGQHKKAKALAFATVTGVDFFDEGSAQQFQTRLHVRTWRARRLLACCGAKQFGHASGTFSWRLGACEDSSELSSCKGSLVPGGACCLFWGLPEGGQRCAEVTELLQCPPRLLRVESVLQTPGLQVLHR